MGADWLNTNFDKVKKGQFHTTDVRVHDANTPITTGDPGLKIGWCHGSDTNHPLSGNACILLTMRLDANWGFQYALYDTQIQSRFLDNGKLDVWKKLT